MMCSMHTSSYDYTILCIRLVVHPCLYKKGIIQSSYIIYIHIYYAYIMHTTSS